MVTGNDPVESFFTSLNVTVKQAFLRFELSIRKVAKDFDCCWSGHGGLNKNWVNHNDVGVGGVKKKSGHYLVSDEKKKGLLVLPGMFSLDASKRGVKERDNGNGDCINCLQFVITWSLLADKFVQGFPSPFKTGKKQFQKMGDENRDRTYLNSFVKVSESRVSGEFKQSEVKGPFVKGYGNEGVVHKERKIISLEWLIGFIFDQSVHNIQKFDQRLQESDHKRHDTSPPNDHLKVVTAILEGRKADVNGFLGYLRFARVGGVPSSIVCGADSVKEESEESVTASNIEETVGSSPQKLASGILDIPISNVERLRSTLSTGSLTEIIELVPQLGLSFQDYPDRKELISVQDFFRYTESEGRRFFEELDRDGDGQVTLEDLEVAMGRRKLPQRYARDFMRCTRSYLFSKSFGWKQFLSLMDQKEPTILRAYTSLCLSKSGTLQKSQILASLKNEGLPANEDNAGAMMRFLNADTEGCISYGHFRNFMLLLPSERLQDDPRNIWSKSATVVAVAPPVEISARSVLISALAGGISCAFSTSLMHPIDTIKTQVQASTLSFPEIIAKLPEIGARGLYRGSIPAILGQFSSHGLRTGIFEASKLVLINVAPNVPEIQVKSLSSLWSTILGTVARIPCEVLKQRLQAGLFDNVGEAIVGTWRQDGLKGFFHGTGATLCREIPFYVAGTGLYTESKKLAQHLLGRDLEPWEIMMVGALAGGLIAVGTTPFDVIKTRMMIAPQGRPVSMSLVAFSILRHEGPLGLFKGAVPRFFWVAPLGAINLAGYELVRNALNKIVEPAA